MNGDTSGGWSPTTQHETDRVTAAAARALHDLLERPGPAPRAGDPLPLLWHWLAFWPHARAADLGADGHPVTGTFLPPTGGRRRMFGGATVSATGTLRVEEALERTSTVAQVDDKRGRSGPLLVVDVDHGVRGAAGDLAERVALVYREQPSGTTAGTTPAPPARAAAGDESWTWRRSVDVDPVLLFRFSALTYNAHRIHYDRDHAKRVEGYPGLVVHGPLQALLLADLAARAQPGARLTGFRFRSHAPVFDGAPLRLVGRPGGEGTVELAVLGASGKPAMTASATLAPAAGG